MKTCSKCKKNKSFLEYSKNIRTRDGLQLKCKNCCKQYREYNKLKNLNKAITIIESLCSKCNITKPISEFSPKKNGPNGIEYWCKPCKRKYAKKYRDTYIEDAREYENSLRQERVLWIQQIKSNTPCADCGKIYEPYCMDYDHLKDKVESISRMVLNHTPKQKILEEIKKCELVCVLCHNIRTYKRLQQKFSNKNTNKSKIFIRNISIINEAKSKPCNICNVQYDLCNMQFDHIDTANKIANICNLKKSSEEELRSEIEKCQILCALCHRKKSIIEQQQNKYTTKSKGRLKENSQKHIYFDVDKEIKECANCNNILSFKLFNYSKNTTCKLQSWCKPCINLYKKERRIING